MCLRWFYRHLPHIGRARSLIPLVLSCSLRYVQMITGKRMNGLSWNFQQRSDIRQAMICNIFGIVRLTPWIQGRFFYFLDQCLLVMLWKNGWTDFNEIVMKCRGRPTKWLSRLFHACLGCLTVSHLGTAACLLATLPWLRKNGWADFHEIFRICWPWHKEKFEYFGDNPFNLLVQGEFFYFGIPESNNMEWQMDGYSWNFQDMDTSSNWINYFMPE